MTHYKKPDEKASQTVTFRLTVKERELLSELAEMENKSLTDLMRSLLNAHAEKIGISRLRESGQDVDSTSVENAGQDKSADMEIGETTAQKPVEETYQFKVEQEKINQKADLQRKPMTFGELAEQFRASFAGRADGTRNELDETIRFLCDRSRGDPLISAEMPLAGLTSTRLERLRGAMKKADMRMAKKNLHLTYLRMMLHWAVKQETMNLKVNPAMELKPFTMNEEPGSWPGRGFIP